MVDERDWGISDEGRKGIYGTFPFLGSCMVYIRMTISMTRLYLYATEPCGLLRGSGSDRRTIGLRRHEKSRFLAIFTSGYGRRCQGRLPLV